MAKAKTRTNLAVAGTDGPTVRARRFVRNNPAAVLIGAFIIGVVLAKVARYA